MTRKTSRRSFLGTSAALGTAFWVAPKTFGRPTRSALEGLTAACIGVGGKGDSDSSHIADQDVEILGICDVDKRTLAKKAKQFTKAEQFTDFREMLDKLGDKMDICILSQTRSRVFIAPRNQALASTFGRAVIHIAFGNGFGFEWTKFCF